MYYLYILLNNQKSRTYTGVTNNLDKRFKEHNEGKVSSSSPYRPYHIAYTECFETLKEAKQREKFFKTTTGRRKLQKLLFSS